MIAQRLIESVLFLETQSRTDADKEYIIGIRKIIEEHAAMREILEQIHSETQVSRIANLAETTLQQTSPSHIHDKIALRETLADLAKLLPSDEVLQNMSSAKAAIHKIMKP
ncbi:MAG: hypothetical protein R8M45_11670 [Ghiorsea sp.]